MIYIHIPFCVRKCSYCAFYSQVTKSDTQPYVDALCREIELRSHLSVSSPYQVRTIYIGGGTPTILPVAQLSQIVDQLRHSFDLSAVEECTIEANPEHLTDSYLKELRQLGIFNRISIGIQSFDDGDLRLLNRRHNADIAKQAISQTLDNGFDNISVDLIYGLPNLSCDRWIENLNILSSFDIKHLSCYALTVEEGTMLERQTKSGQIKMPSDEIVVNQYNALIKWCSENGFEQYEISNFCKPFYHSRHNSRYWNRTPYFGFGASAHSFDGSSRRWNISDYRRYIECIDNDLQFHECERLTDIDEYNEYIMTSLRTTHGIELSLVAPRFVSYLQQNIQKFISSGLLSTCSYGYKPTQEGLLHADGIAAELFFS